MVIMNRIMGIGIDMTRISRFHRLIEKYEERFVYKTLHLKEVEQYKSVSDLQQKSRFLASRWAFKEALVKATGNKAIIFSSVYIEKDVRGKPYLKIDKESYKGDLAKYSQILALDDS